MNEENRDGNGVFDEIVAKLTPKVLALLITTAMILLSVIIGIAVVRGKDVSLFGIQISQPSKICQEDLMRCEQSLSQAIRITEAQEVIGAAVTRDQVLDTLRSLIKYAEQAVEWRLNFNYKLFELEQEMHRLGGFISTRIQEPTRTKVYKMIQIVLSDVDFYEGIIDGEQRATHQALVAFQNDYNQRVTETERIASLGSFGFHTLEAIRSRYRQLSK